MVPHLTSGSVPAPFIAHLLRRMLSKPMRLEYYKVALEGYKVRVRTA